MNTKTSLHANHLSCIRQNKPLFSNLSFELNAGEALLIKGPNGSGKSSLLRILAGLATPTHGEHLWCGEKIEDQRLHYFNHLHYISHNNGLKLELSIIENLQLAAHLALVQIPDLQTMLSQLQLLADQQTSVKYLSAGQKRRVALAKLFLIPKPLWILDEPLTSLDETAQHFFITQLQQHLKQNGICIMSAHQTDCFHAIPFHQLMLPC